MSASAVLYVASSDRVCADIEKRKRVLQQATRCLNRRAEVLIWIKISNYKNKMKIHYAEEK